MSAEQLQLPEFRPLPPHFASVVVDDEVGYAWSTARAVADAATALDLHPGPVLHAQNWYDALRMPFIAAEGHPAHVVLLDNLFTENQRTKWNIRYSELREVFGLAGREGVADRIPAQFLLPDSINFALLLRLMGYDGNIFVTSSTPPEANEYISALQELRTVVPTLPHRFPVDGMTIKKPMPIFNEMNYATGIVPAQRGYEWEVQVVRGTLVQSLSALLKRK